MILFPEIAEQRKHYLSGLMQFNSFFQNKTFACKSQLITYNIPNETSLFKKDICCIHLKRKPAACTKSFNL